MPVTQYDQPVYVLTCDNTECPNDEGIESTLDTDGYRRYFDSERAAREWAEANGWSLRPTLCPPCAADARDLADHNAEIAAAIGYAITPTP
jgi:hypothetical protein